MVNINDYKMLESTVWKLLDLLDSKGMVEETQQTFSLVNLQAFTNTHSVKLNEILNTLREVSNHQPDKRYQETYTLKK